MSEISVFGAGAFGTALAISLARDGHAVSLVARNALHAKAMAKTNQNESRLPGISFPPGLTATADPTDPAMICLIAVPAQSLGMFMRQHRQEFVGRTIVACCKGVDLATGLGPTSTILNACPTSEAAILSGPSFAADIAAGLPTALTIATRSAETAKFIQQTLSTQTIRLYRTTDTIGVELGGALKNVMAIAAGITIGAGLGESARAALMARGYEELKRYATDAGALADTLSGLSGFGDLVLTCTSEKSRNFAHGVALGRGDLIDPNITVEGKSTALAIATQSKTRDIDMPITNTVAGVLSGELAIQHAIRTLLSRPLTKE